MGVGVTVGVRGRLVAPGNGGFAALKLRYGKSRVDLALDRCSVWAR